MFQTREWLDSWFEHVGRRRGVVPCLVAIYDAADTPALFLPLQIESRGGLSVLGWLGDELVDYGAPIVASGRVDIADAWSTVLTKLPPVDIVRLARIPAAVGIVDNPMLGLQCQRYHSRAHFVELDGDWEDFYERHAGAKTRSTDRRKERRLKKSGTLEIFTGVTGGDALFDAIAGATTRMKVERYRAMRAPNIMARQGVRDFFEHPATFLRNSGMLHLSAVSLDGDMITTHWGMRHGDRFYYYMPSYTGGPWMKFSPGRILLFEMFRWCFNNGVKVFDFTVGDEAYKKDWCDRDMTLHHHIDGRTARGRAAAAAERARALLLANPVVLEAARSVRRLFHLR